MSDASARLALPWLQPGQAQKEMFHNEALARIDIALHAVVEAVDAATPAPAPQRGQCWALGPAPTGEWAGRGGMLAGWTEGGWRFVALPVGAMLWSIADGLAVRRGAGGWIKGVVPATRIEIGGQQVVGPRCPAVAAPTGGTTTDAAARAAINAILQALRDHGLIAT